MSEWTRPPFYPRPRYIPAKWLQRGDRRAPITSWAAFDSAQQLQRHRRTSRGQWFYVNPQTNEKEI